MPAGPRLENSTWTKTSRSPAVTESEVSPPCFFSKTVKSRTKSRGPPPKRPSANCSISTSDLPGCSRSELSRGVPSPVNLDFQHEPKSLSVVARILVVEPPQEAPPQTGEYSEALH